MSDTPSEPTPTTQPPAPSPATDPTPADPVTDPAVPVEPVTEPAPAPATQPSSDPTAQADSNVQAPTATTLAPADAVTAAAPAPVLAAPPAIQEEPTSAELIGVPTPSPVPEANAEGQQMSTHAIAAGSAGAPVQQLAQQLEAAGEKTYLSDPTAQNPAHVFTDELMAAVKRVLHSHPSIANVTDEAERQRLNRWIGGLEVITAEVQRLISEVGAEQQKTAETSSTTAATS
jgi:hypothetical protein